MIYLLWPTIRPLSFPSNHSSWIRNSSDTSKISTIVLVSTESDQRFVQMYLDKNSLDGKVVCYSPPYPGVCLPSYKLSSSLSGEDTDLVVLASDDFSAPGGWDRYIFEKLEGRTSCLLVNDGYQKLDFSNMEHPVVSIPIMTFGCLVKLNKIIYHPSYTHLYSDCELYYNLNQMSLLIDDRSNSPDVIFKHNHWSSGKRTRDSHDNSYYSNSEKDRLNWLKRKDLSLEERLRISPEFL